MPETLFHKDFSAGWCPSDDAVNGRPNCLLQMDNLELDHNGALSLCGGTILLNSPYPASAHTLYSRFVNDVRFDYLALSDGSVYRNEFRMITGGDPFNAAFSTAFNYVLICSGSQRYKDPVISPMVKLGVEPPLYPPTVRLTDAGTPTANVGYMQANILQIDGNVAVIDINQYIQCKTDPATGIFAIQTFYTFPPSPYPFDTTTLTGAAGTGHSTDEDILIISGYTTDPRNISLQFDIILDPPDGAGSQVQDFYSYTVRDLATQATFETVSGVFTLRIRRADFTKVGGAAVDWSSVFGFRLTINNNQGTGETIVNIWGAIMGDPWFKFRGSTLAQFGTYQYCQVNVNNTGSYLAKSVAGPITAPITIDGFSVQIQVEPPFNDPQVNEVWVFRRGGNLGQWYRIAVVKPPWDAFWDNMGDQAALDLNITININLVSIASITDKIYDIVGPIQGRWYYFTTNFMYPSDINDPDLVDPNIAIRTTGSNSEIFMWARNVSASVVVVGTSVDCYLLTGTFSTFPDNTIDVYYQSLGVKFPPTTYDAAAYGGSIYYYAADGWRMLLPTSFGSTYANQNNQLIVAPNLDRLYRGEVCHGYDPPRVEIHPGYARFPVTVAKNKLWCFINGTWRSEVYDFVRQYWRTFNYNLGEASACTATQDNKVLAFYPGDKRLREIDAVTTKLIDGATQQAFKMLFTFKDNGRPRQRKDTYTFKSRCWTSTGSMQIELFDENNNQILPMVLMRSPITNTEVFQDLSQYLTTKLPKSYQISIFGSSDDFHLTDWSIDYDARPIPLTFLRIYPSNLGSASQKRVRTWPLVIDSMNNYITFTPDVDGINQPSTIFQTNSKRTVFHYFTQDVFGIDYGGTLFCNQPGMMEVWDTGLGGGGLQPEVVQNLPVPKKYDQVGPVEIFRFGKIVRIALRIQSNGTPIPYRIYFGDALTWSGEFNVVTSAEDEYIVDVPKGTNGRILRIELGPTNFTFSRYFMKLQVAISGGQADTELAWVTVPGVSQYLAQGI